MHGKERSIQDYSARPSTVEPEDYQHYMGHETKGQWNEASKTLVARGYEQVAGQNYDPKGGQYSPVLTLIGFKICCVLILMMSMCAHIVDVQGAFLTGDMSDQPVYMEVPQGFEEHVGRKAKRSYLEVVLMLFKSLYGLIQSSNLFWRKQSKTMMTDRKLERNKADYCIYYKWIADKLFLSVSWVDDMIMASANESEIGKKKEELKGTFDIDDCGPMKEFVGCKIEHNRQQSTMKFTQPILMQSFNDEFKLPKRGSNGTPAAPGSLLQAYKNEQMLSKEEQSEFRKAVGKLWFLAHVSRHDILHAV